MLWSLIIAYHFIYLIRNQEKLIDDLMFGEESAQQIVEQHREQVEQEEKKKSVFSHAG